MNLQDKLDALRNELESRQTPPPAKEVWSSVEHGLNATRRRIRKILFSLIALIALLISLVFFDQKDKQTSHTDKVQKENGVLQAGPGMKGSVNGGEVAVPVNPEPAHKGEDPVNHESIAAPVIQAHPNASFESGAQRFRKKPMLKSPFGQIPLERTSIPGYRDEVFKGSETRKSMDQEAFTNKLDEPGDQKKEPEPAVLDAKEVINPQSLSDSLNSVKKKQAVSANQQEDTAKKGGKRFVVRPYAGVVFNQLKPFSVPGKPYVYPLLSNYNAGVLLDCQLSSRNMLSLNFGFIKMPSKIEFLDRNTNPDPVIIKVMNSNNLILGLEFSRFNKNKNWCFNIGSQMTMAGKKYNYIEQKLNGPSIFHQQKYLPAVFQDNSLAMYDFLVNLGLSYCRDKSVWRINYFQGLVDISSKTSLFNPHAFVQLNYSYRLLRF